MRIALVVHRANFPGSLGEEFDGFTARYRSLLDALRVDHEVFVIECETGATTGMTQWPGVAWRRTSVQIDRRAGSRWDRVVRFVGRLVNYRLGHGWPRSLDRLLRLNAIDVVLVATYMNVEVAVALSSRWPTVYFAEEEGVQGFDPWGKTSAPFHAIELWGLRLALRRLRGVVVISPTQVDWAAAYFAKRVRVVPHAVDLEFWQTPQSVLSGSDAPIESSPSVFVIGRFSRVVEAKGLLAISDELATRPVNGRPVVILASGDQPHALLDDVDPEIFKWIGGVEDPRRYYATATVALVPAFVVSGAKTTILQAWASGCPVVTTPAAAASVNARSGIDLVIGETPKEVVDGIYELLRDPERRQILAANGTRHVLKEHGPAAVAASLQAVLADLFNVAPVDR